MSVPETRKRNAKARRRLVGVGCGLLIAGGCANIIGLSDLEDKDNDAVIIGDGGGAGESSGGDDTPAAGKGGSSSGGTGGLPGVGGTVTAGSGGTSDGGTSDGGGGGEVIGPANCDVPSLDINQGIVDSCILRGSCSPFVPKQTVSECISKNTQGAFADEACTKTALDCSDVETCEGAGYANCGVSDTLYCEDNQAVYCDAYTTAGYDYFVDCTKYGGTCEEQSDGFVDCSIASISTCDDADYTNSHCGGTGNKFNHYCFDDVGWGRDCTKFGLVCSEDVDGAAECVDSVPSCAGGDSDTCVRSSIQRCLNGKQIIFECGTVGLDCALEGDVAQCVAPGCTTTDVEDCAEACDGATMTLCYGGVPFDVDCGDYGFSSCVLWDPGGSITTQYASCADL